MYHGNTLQHGSLFSGIGGFDLAADMAGWENRFHCEWNDFGKKVLTYYWPMAESYGDITKTDFTIWRGRIDVLTGGFPCQPYSLAGKRLGKDDERHLWPEMLRAIREIQPRWVVGENVLGLTSWNGGLVFDEVQADLEAAGYEVQAYVLPAASVGAPHRRDRVWFVAHARYDGQHGAQNGQGNRKRNDGNEAGPRPAVEPPRCGCEATGAGWTSAYCANAGTKGVQQEWQHGIFGLEPAADADGNGHQYRGLGQNRPAQAEGKGQGHQRERLWNDGGGNGQSGAAPDTSCQQGERLRPELGKPCQPQQGEYRGNGCRLGFGRDASNAGRCERQDRVHGHQQRRQAEEFGDSYTKFGRWSKFPITEPTIRKRNDGVPAGLDGITFPKWRNESIKAYGNAIVPQVAFQIFKAINLYETRNNASER